MGICITYFTVGPKEARAWTIQKGWTRAPASRRRHPYGDFEKGFIRAETIAYDDYVSNKARPARATPDGLRLEGKEYVVARTRPEHATERTDSTAAVRLSASLRDRERELLRRLAAS